MGLGKGKGNLPTQNCQLCLVAVRAAKISDL